MAKRFKPNLKVLCSLGTIAHNRSFDASELRQWPQSLVPSQVKQTMSWLKKHKLIKVNGKGKYFPTPKGWNMIKKACSR